jgi:hypothetical protein
MDQGSVEQVLLAGMCRLAQGCESDRMFIVLKP